MEKLNDLLSNIKERFTSPLIFSFICSWLFINWQITVGLLWYDPAQIDRYGSESIFDFINSHLSTANSITYPLSFAIVYTILSPILKNLIKAFHSWSQKWGENWSLSIMQGRKIGIEKYLTLRENLEKRTAILEDVIDKERSHINENQNLKTEKLELENQVNSLKSEIAKERIYISNLKDSKFMEGVWICTYKRPNEKEGKETISIRGRDLHIMKDFGKEEKVFRIDNFLRDTRNGTIYFVKRKEIVGTNNETKQFTYLINELHERNDNLLVGYENDLISIQYERIK